MIERVKFDSAAMSEFVDLPWSIYRDDPGWIPPIKDSVRATLGPTNPFFAHGEAAYFLARDGGEVIGRCAAFIDPRMRGERGAIGTVGHFESPDDETPAHALLDAAVSWLEARGVAEVLGPLDISILNGYRFMVAGFDRPPHMGEPRNPPYYPTLFEGYGFTVTETHQSWEWRSLDLDRWEDELAFVHELVMDGFSDHRGFAPVTLEEYLFWQQGVRPLVDPHLIPILVAPDGTDGAFGYVVPDYANALRALDGDAERFTAAIAEHPPTQPILHTVVVRPAHRNMRVVPAGFARALERTLDKGYLRAIGAFARKERPAFYHHVGTPSREYNLYALEV
jgi:hypothetical protein